MAVKEYPGRDSNPHATKAVALKATVSNQIPPPGRAAQTLSAQASAAKRGPLARDGYQLTVQ
jgi:hypothetical protein